jgi:hypothetical protein
MQFNPTARLLAPIFAWAVMTVGMQAATADDALPSRRVVASYFHRTVRCPTCQKVGSSIEEVLKASFAAELRNKRLEWRTMDFQDPRNATYVSAFGITAPTFIIMDVQDNRVIAWKAASKAWSLLGDKEAFSRYVQAEVRSVLEAKPVVAR